MSGTIAGQKENTETENLVLGVAPNVYIYGYRVLGPYGSGAISGIIADIEKAVEDGMDVINMSLGNSVVNNPFDANVKNEIVEKMNLQMGENYFKQDELNTIFASGYYPNGDMTGMSTMAIGDGNVRVAGVEREDLKDGLFRVSLDYANAGKVSGKPEDFIFIKEDTKYLSLDVINKNINEEDILKTSISLNNSEDVVDGKFKIQSRGDALININSVDNFRGIDENLMNDSQFNYNTLNGLSGEFKNSKEEIVDIKASTMHKNVDIEHRNRTLIYGDASNMIIGVKGSKIYALDDNGNRYEPTYVEYNEMFDNGNIFALNNIPVIERNYKGIVETPGAFNGVMSVPGSKLSKDGEVIGNTFSINGESYLASTGILSVLGDTNGD